MIQNSNVSSINVFFCRPQKLSLPINHPIPLPSIPANINLIQFHHVNVHHVHIAINCWATRTNQNISFDMIFDTIVFSLQRLCFAILRMTPVPKEVCTQPNTQSPFFSISFSLSTLHINIYIYIIFSSVKHNLWFCFSMCLLFHIYTYYIYSYNIISIMINDE